MSRTSQEILADIKTLVHTPGYIYSLCLILYEDFHVEINKIHKVDHWAKLSVKECSLIIGFLAQKEIDYSFPHTLEETFGRKEKTYALMEELHVALNAPQFTKLREMIERQESGEVFKDDRQERIDFFAKDGSMIEPMFYAGDGVYDFQYMEYLDAKYKYDKEWLLQNKGFDIASVREIVSTIKAIAKKRSEKVLPVDIREIFPTIAAKARKKLKKTYSKEKIDELEREQLIYASFYRYKSLFPNPNFTSNDSIEDWKVFYQNLLELFIIRPSNLIEINDEAVAHFFENFSFSPACNEDYKGPGHYNVLNSRPLINLGGQRFMLPIGYLLPEAVYESPFYWMWEDKSYRSNLAKNRGDVGEEIAYELLSQVFGKNNTYRSVLVETKKGQRETDIDVLCILGNKVLCVQVKSKKLTLNAKRGDFEQLSKDFKGAVQDAYDQGLVSRKALFKRKAKFINLDGKEIVLPDRINEVYIMGLTTENYPTLAHQTHILLSKNSEDPYPLFVSAFDLELLVHYLKDPYDFLYYVRQRIRLMDYFRADEELVYLGYHLDKKLWPQDGFDFGSIETDFGKIIDRNYYPYKTGISHKLPKKDDPILNRWKDPQFDLFIKAVKAANHPNTTDIIFYLLDWSGESRKDIVAHMFKLNEASRRDGTMKSLATSFASDFGLSYIVTNNRDSAELEYRTITYAQLRKYLCKSDTWLGLGTYSASPHLIDTLIYLDKPWQFDPELEKDYQDELRKMKNAPKTLIKGKIGRNAPCPCKSGKKFKNCCMAP